MPIRHHHCLNLTFAFCLHHLHLGLIFFNLRKREKTFHRCRITSLPRNHHHHHHHHHQHHHHHRRLTATENKISHRKLSRIYREKKKLFIAIPSYIFQRGEGSKNNYRNKNQNKRNRNHSHKRSLTVIYGHLRNLQSSTVINHYHLPSGVMDNLR